ncbi:putative pre-mRNA-splicing factor ATP-dependent RNA helicase [Apostasia shenzhenica]|uniref:RNA helicase n=1 Tax=Apostasia shenzhenica TaxID=1088818 RepID=A0A2I0AS78_9ASPA|nr:putative pre-mRNA-splicing factor ATP-dependent RNA helicase [Apostasia shenzhenica]
MGKNFKGGEQVSTTTSELLGSGEIQDGFVTNGVGSNAFILPGKKRRKTKGIGKVSKIKAKEAQSHRKSKQRKLQKLQEEKEKKLILSKSISVLQKYKIKDESYSILQSSGTIGQPETAREKRRLALQYSKAGLEVPEGMTLFKTEKTPCGKDVIEHFDQDYLPINNGDSRGSMKELKKEDCSSSYLEKTVKESNEGESIVKSLELNKCSLFPPGKAMNNSGSSQQHSFQKNSNDANLIPNDKVLSEDNKSFISTPSVSDTCLEGKSSQGTHVSPKPFKVSDPHTIPGPSKTAIVVPVSRPQEVEEERRDLPIIMMEQEIMEAINDHPILILCGETGCGKTTQVPQFLYEAGYGTSGYGDRKGIIGITQPRRVAVLATAKRVSYELGFYLGKEVGFQVRHDRMIGSNCSIKFMTDGILLRETQSDILLKRYSIIILDEAHERSLNTDILIGMLSRIVKLRQDLYENQQKQMHARDKISPHDLIFPLKLVIMSATLRVEDFTSNRKLFHQTPPVLEVPIRQFPVTVHFSRKTPEDYLGQAYKKILSIHKKLPPGAILAFVTGQREVEFLCKKLRRASQKFCENGLRKENASGGNLEQDIQPIDEAFGMQSSPNLPTNMFGSYEEEDIQGNNQNSSDSDTESEVDEDSEDDDSLKTENLEGGSSVIDFLRNPGCLSSLKAAFEALAENSSIKSSAEKPEPQLALQSQEATAKPAAAVGPLYVLPLYAMLPASAQLRVFEQVPEGERLVVVATNVAETSLTIPGIKYVVDTGKEKVKSYNYGNGIATYEVQWISKASASQRAGRAGRTGPGHCYRLYSSAAFSKDDIFPEFSCPEISKVPVESVVLLLKFMNIDKVENFPFPTPPKASALEEAERCLMTIEALDMKSKLTPTGRAMAQYPMSPRHSRLILTVIEILRNQPVFGRANLVLGYAIAAAAALSFPSPFLFQLEWYKETQENDYGQEDKIHENERTKDHGEEQRKKRLKAIAKECRARFCNPSSDALTVAYALQLFELTDNAFQFCRNNYLHLKTMEEMSKLRKQILQLTFHSGKLCREFSWVHGGIDDVEAAWRKNSAKHPLQLIEEQLLGQAICAGWADRIAKRMRISPDSSDKVRKAHSMQYQSCAMDDVVYLHRRSSVSQTAPEFLVYSELLCTTKPYMHGVTTVKPDWLVRYASSLCSFSPPLMDPKPYYEPLSDRSFCWVSTTFGRHNWQLPLHSLPIKDEILRVSVFAYALLAGNVLPCLKNARDFLAASPSIILRPEALGHRRVGDLLSALRTRSSVIDSRKMLREAWNENPMFLHLEVGNWFQAKFGQQFELSWKQMLQEATLEGCELFPKRMKKDRNFARHG